MKKFSYFIFLCRDYTDFRKCKKAIIPQYCGNELGQSNWCNLFRSEGFLRKEIYDWKSVSSQHKTKFTPMKLHALAPQLWVKDLEASIDFYEQKLASGA